LCRAEAGRRAAPDASVTSLSADDGRRAANVTALTEGGRVLNVTALTEGKRRT
jgi:hypothetical protein